MEEVLGFADKKQNSQQAISGVVAPRRDAKRGMPVASPEKGNRAAVKEVEIVPGMQTGL